MVFVIIVVHGFCFCLLFIVLVLLSVFNFMICILFVLNYYIDFVCFYDDRNMRSYSLIFCLLFLSMNSLFLVFFCFCFVLFRGLEVGDCFVFVWFILFLMPNQCQGFYASLDIL